MLDPLLRLPSLDVEAALNGSPFMVGEPLHLLEPFLLSQFFVLQEAHDLLFLPPTHQVKHKRVVVAAVVILLLSLLCICNVWLFFKLLSLQRLLQ